MPAVVQTEWGLVYVQAGPRLENYAFANLKFVVDEAGRISFSSVGDQQTVSVDASRDRHAFIQVLDHDRDSSQIYSCSGLGDYYRPIANGTYSFRASCPGNITKTYTGVTATYGNPTDLLIELIPGEDTLSIQTIETSTNQAFTLYPNPTTGKVHIKSTTNTLTQSHNNAIKIYSLYGQLLQELPATATSLDLTSYHKGTYIIKIGPHAEKVVKY